MPKVYRHYCMQRHDTVVCSKLVNTLAGKIAMEWIQGWTYLTAIETISKECFCLHIQIMNSSIVTWKVYCGCSIQAYSNYKNICRPTLHGVAIRQECYRQHIHIVSSSLVASKVKRSRAIQNSSNYNNACTTSTNAPTTSVQPVLTRWQVWLCVENGTAKFCATTHSLVNLC